nr:hypothetical protein Iba_chr13bCG12140 [Ipomoea batatas]
MVFFIGLNEEVYTAISPLAFSIASSSLSPTTESGEYSTRDMCIVRLCGFTSKNSFLQMPVPGQANKRQKEEVLTEVECKTKEESCKRYLRNETGGLTNGLLDACAYGSL